MLILVQGVNIWYTYMNLLKKQPGKKILGEAQTSNNYSIKYVPEDSQGNYSL